MKRGGWRLLIILVVSENTTTSFLLFLIQAIEHTRRMHITSSIV